MIREIQQAMNHEYRLLTSLGLHNCQKRAINLSLITNDNRDFVFSKLVSDNITHYSRDLNKPDHLNMYSRIVDCLKSSIDFPNL